MKHILTGVCTENLKSDYSGDEVVCRGKAQFLRGCKSLPARSLQPVAIGAGGEATSRLKPSMERIVRRFGECAGCNVSKRSAGLENNNVEADLTTSQGKLPLLGKGG
jgi:hypothetical protein